MDSYNIQIQLMTLINYKYEVKIKTLLCVWWWATNMSASSICLCAEIRYIDYSLYSKGHRGSGVESTDKHVSAKTMDRVCLAHWFVTIYWLLESRDLLRLNSGILGELGPLIFMELNQQEFMEKIAPASKKWRGEGWRCVWKPKFLGFDLLG